MRRGLAGLIIALAASAAVFLPASAQTAPALVINSATAYRSVVTTGDLFILYRYELPQQLTDSPVSPEAWCAELEDTTGCTGSVVDPDNPGSLDEKAYLTFCDFTVGDTGCLTGGGDLLAMAETPRIHHALGGIYIQAGHGLTWGDASHNACVESSTTAYVTPAQDCIPVVYNGEPSDQESQRDALGAGLVAALRLIERDRNLPRNSYIVNNKVSGAGFVLAQEALSVMASVVPEVFQAAAIRSITEGFQTPNPATVLPLQARISATATVTAGQATFRSTGQRWFGGNSSSAGTLLWFAISAGIGLAMWKFTQSAVFAVLGVGAGLFTGMSLGVIPVSVIAVGTGVLFFPAAFWVWKKLFA